MSDESGKAVLNVVAENNTKGTFQEIKDDANRMAKGVKKSSEEAKKGLDGMGDGADEAAKKLAKAQSSMAASLQRYIEKTQVAAAAGDSLAKAFEKKIELRGIDGSALNPLIQKAREAEDALARMKAQQAQTSSQNGFIESLRSQSEALGKTRSELLAMQAAQLGVGTQAAPFIAKLRESEAGLGRIGQTAGQTRQALQQLPLQFQDIIVSLQAGQAPLTVFLQQGSQLAGSFGGIGAAAKAMGLYVFGLVNPLTLAAAAVAVLGVAYSQGSKEVDGYRMSLVLSGNQVGTSIEQLSGMARQISAVTGTQGAAAAALSTMAQKSKVGADSLREYTTAAILWEKATGEGVDKVAGKFADLAKDPLQASLKLNEEMNHLTASVYDQIKALEKQGQTTDAAAMAQRAYADALNSRQSEIIANLGYVERAWNSVAGAAKSAWDKMLGVGRAATPMSAAEKRIADLESQIADRNSRAKEDKDPTWAIGTAKLQKQLDATKALQGAMASVDSFIAGMGANNKDYVDSMEDYDKVAGQFASKETKRKAALTVEQNKYAAAVEATKKAWAGSSELDKKLADLKDKHQKSVSGINKQFEEKGGGNSGASAVAGIHARIQAEEELIKRLQLHGKNAEKVSEADKMVAQLQYEVDHATNGRVKTEKLAELAQAKQFQALQNKRLEMERGIKTQDDSEKSYRKYIDSIYKSADAIGDQASQQDAANVSFGKSKLAIAELAMQQAKLAAVNAKNVGPWTPEQVKALADLAAQHERYVESLRQAEFLGINKKYDERVRAAKDELEVERYSMSLLGEQESTRDKLVAIRRVELRLAKELAEIEKLYNGKTDEKSVKQRAELEYKARVTAETELQSELGRIQNQYVTQQVRKYDDIWRQGFADMANNGMDGLKAFGKSLKTTVLTSVADAIYQALFRKYVVNLTASITGGLEGIFGMMGGAAGGATSAVSSGNSLMNIASGVNNIFSFFTNGSFKTMLSGSTWGTSLLYGKIGQGLGFSSMGAGGMGPPALTASGGAMSSMMSYVPYAAMIAAGMMMSGTAYDQGYRLGHGEFLGAHALTGGIAPITISLDTKILEGLGLSGRTANMITGASLWAKGISKLFGRTLKDAGVEGDFGGDTGFEGRKYEFYKGGLFRSNKTKYSELDEETRKNFADRFGLVRDGVSDMAESIGLSAEKLDTFTGKIKLSLMGLSSEDMNKKISEEFKKLADDMAAIVLDTDKYTQGEETRAETLARLSGRMVGVNQWLEVMGDKLLEVSVVGADMASSLVDAFGGDDAFKSSTESYLSKYFTDIEKFDLINKQVGTALKELGIDTVPATRDALKELINAQDLTTEAGRKAYASLLGLADVLDVVYSAADQLAALNLDLDIELLRAQGKDSEALALERERRIKELMLYGDDVVAKQRKIWEEQDKRTADEARKAEEDAIAEKMRKGREDAQNKAMRNLEEATNREINSLNAQKSALNEQRTLANESLSLVTGIFDLVRQNARELYGSVESTAVMQASQGRAFIEQALGVALKTGYLPEQDQLSQAISAARAGIDDGAFASQVDRDYDTLVLAGKLSALELLTGKQKTTAEQQLESLDRQITSIDKQSKFLQDQLAQIKDLISIAKGEYDATMSVEQAVRDVYRLFDLKTSKPTTPTPGEKDPAGDVVGGGGSPGAAPKHGDRTADGGYFREVVGPTGSFLSPTTGADTEYLKGVDKWLDKYRETGNVEGMLLDAKASGYRMNDLAAIMGWKYMDLVDAGKRLGIPQFAVGTNYVPEDMTARIHKGERIIPAADNKALFAALNGGSKGGSNAELVAAINKLEARLAEIENNTAKGAEFGRQTADNINQVTEGGNAMRTAATT